MFSLVKIGTGREINLVFFPRDETIHYPSSIFLLFLLISIINRIQYSIIAKNLVAILFIKDFWVLKATGIKPATLKSLKSF